MRRIRLRIGALDEIMAESLQVCFQPGGEESEAGSPPCHCGTCTHLREHAESAVDG